MAVSSLNAPPTVGYQAPAPAPSTSLPPQLTSVSGSRKKSDKDGLSSNAIAAGVGLTALGAAAATGATYFAMRDRGGASTDRSGPTPQSLRTYAFALSSILAKEQMREANPAHQAPPANPFDRSRPWYHEALNGPSCAMNSLNMLFNGEKRLRFGMTDFTTAAKELPKAGIALNPDNPIILSPNAFVAMYNERLAQVAEYLEKAPLPKSYQDASKEQIREFKADLASSRPHVQRFLAEKPALMCATHTLTRSTGDQVPAFGAASRKSLESIFEGTEQFAFRRPIHDSAAQVILGFDHHYATIAHRDAHDGKPAGWWLLDSVHEHAKPLCEGPRSGAAARGALENALSDTRNLFGGETSADVDVFVPTKQTPTFKHPFMRERMRVELR